MKESSSKASPADLRMIIGKRPWRVWKGVGSFLLFEFGRPRSNGLGGRKGTFRLRIAMAEWRIKKASRELAHSESPDKAIHRAAAELQDHKLESVFLRTFITKHQLHHGASFRFEGGYSVNVWAYERCEADDDIFFVNSTLTVIAYRSDGRLISHPYK